MKATRGEGGHAGHHRNKRALTDPPLHNHHHHHRHRLSPHTLTSTQNNPRLRPSHTHASVVRDSRGSVEVGGLHGLLIEWVHWRSMWRSGASPGAEAELRAARKSRKARREDAGRAQRDALKTFPSLIQRRVYSRCCSGSNIDTKNLNTSQCQASSQSQSASAVI